MLASSSLEGSCHSRRSHGVVGEEEPEAKNGLGKNIENSIANDLTVDGENT